MSDGQIVIRVSAVADKSLETVFGNYEKRSQRAGPAIAKALNAPFTGVGVTADKASREIERSWNRQLAQLNRVAREQDKLYERVSRNKARVEEKAAKESIRTAEKAAKERVRIEERANREIERAFRAATREAEREENKRTRAAERELSKQQTIRRRFSERVSERATHFLFPPPMGILGAAGRVAGGIIRGAGIDTSFEGGIRRNIELESRGVALANAERIATGQTRGGGSYTSLARKIGDDLKVAPEQVQSLMERFSAVSGQYGENLAKVAPALASMAVASGTKDFGSVGNAAAMAYNQTKGGPNGIGDMLSVMRGTIGQAAEGAVDPADYAKHMGRIAAGAFKFKGDRSENILKLSALTQLAMERGATSPADAARGTASFVNTFGKGARIKAFRAHGVNPFTDKNEDTFDDPFELIRKSFRETKGNIPALSIMFADVLGRKGVDSLGAVYKQAGGGEAGITAIDKELNRYMRANLTADTERKNIADRGGTAEAKAQDFQNQLDKVTSELMQGMLPALQKLKDPAISVANAFAKVATFVAENPFKSLSVAATLAITRAFAEMKLRSVLEQAINGSGSKFMPGAAFGVAGAGGAPGTTLATRGGGGITGGGLGVVGNAMAAMQIATLAVTTVQIGAAYIDSLFDESQARQKKDLSDDIQAANNYGSAWAAARDSRRGVTPEQRDQLSNYEQTLQKRIDQAQGYKEYAANKGFMDDVADFGSNVFTLGKSGEKDRKAELDAGHLESMKAEMSELKRIMADIRGGVIRVEVTNQPDAQPRVDGSGRGDKSGDSD